MKRDLKALQDELLVRVLTPGTDRSLTPPTVQEYICEWQDVCFGPRMNRLDRAGHAFIEEAIELAQAVGISELDVLAHVRRVYSKPIGEPTQEVGGVMLTLAPVARALGRDMEDLALIELMSCIDRTDAIAAKYALKEKAFLPA